MPTNQFLTTFIMRKITNLFTLLMLAICSIGASATTVQTTVTIADGNTSHNPVGYFCTRSNPTLTTTANAGLAGVTIRIDNSAGQWDQANLNSVRHFCMKPGAGQTSTKVIITAPDGYTIKDYSVTFNLFNASYPYIVSSNPDETDIVNNGTAVTSQSSNVVVSASDVNAQSTNFSVYYSGGSTIENAGWLAGTYFTITLENEVYEYTYTYTMYDGTTLTSLGSGSGTATGTSSGYMFTLPDTPAGYAYMGAADPATMTQLNLSGSITATNIALIYSPIITDLANTSSTKVYTLTTPRGYFYAESATQLNGHTGTADATNPMHQWTFVTLDGNMYLYNVGTKKLATFLAVKGRDLVTSAPAVLTTEKSETNPGYPLVFRFTNSEGTTYTMNMNGSCIAMIDTWTEHDKGNTLQIVQVPQITITPDVYKVNFTNSTGTLASVYVDGKEVALGTDIVLTSAATVSSSTSVNAIESYNGFATLAEALADASFAGTVDVALVQNITDITLNVTRGTTVIKTVTVTGVPEGTTVNVAEAVGSPAYVSDITPAEVVGSTENQTVAVTYTSSLPMELADDPEDPDATAYLMTLRTTYAHGNVSSASTYDLSDQTYYWVFGGDEFNGITVYNRGNGYMSVGSTADNSVATFSSTPTAFEIKPNANETNGFNLNIPGTNAYINRRDNKVSTWLSANANNEVGSCLVVYTVNEAISNLITSDIDPYFDYAGCVNALQVTDALNLWPEYSALKAAPNYNDYLTFKAKVEGYQMVEATEGYYQILSGLDAFRTKQSVDKAMYYNDNSKKVAWDNENADAVQIMKLKAVEGTTSYRLYVPLADAYLQSKDGTTNADEASGLAFDVVAKKAAKVALVYNAAGGTDAALHAAGHASGAGVSGSLTGWTADGDASMWILVPATIDEITLISPDGVADGEEVVQGFANNENAQLPLNIGVYTISEETGIGAHLDTIATSQIAGGVGYIISGPKGKVVPLLPIGDVPAPAGNLLVAGDGTLVNGGFILAYKNGEDQAKFWPITGLTVPANRSYLPEGTPTLGLENIFGGLGVDVTGINGVTTGSENGAIYDLQGRRVNNATKGVYIINGKKVIK